MADKMSFEQFKGIVKDHSINVLRDDGLYRHMVCAAPGTMMESFQIITWPGYLCIFGDMGTYVFHRIDDMFGFFRDKECKNRINASYWHEKLEAIDRHSKSKEFDIDKFKDNVKEYITSTLDVKKYEDIDDDKKEEARHLLEVGDEYEAVTAIRDFNSEWLSFDDFWDSNYESYTCHYIFACYAIVWAIERYDNTKIGGSNGN